jgi:hypothetical protein
MAKRLNLQRMLREIEQDASLKRDISDRLTQSEIRKIFARKKSQQQSP